MLTLLCNIECFCPSYIGKKDILVAAGKIYKIMPAGHMRADILISEIMDCEGLYAFPGLIDQHLHITGGGGEEGFISRIGEIYIDEILSAGVTTIVGLLGADGCTRSLENLYAKAKALEAQGLTTYIYSGSYELPPVTLTGSIKRDLVMIDKVIGAGEIAISDHRSSQPDVNKFLKVSCQAHIGGLIGGKPGVVHIHVGDGKGGLKLLCDALEQSDLPIGMFVPTHVNRNPELFRQAIEYYRSGGNIDLTAGETAGLPVWQAVGILKSECPELDRITVSSDANGSVPGGGVTKIITLYEDIIEIIKRQVLEPEQAIRLVTENVARLLKLYPDKGVLCEGSDADILITDKNYIIKKLFVMGKLLINKSNNSGG